MTVQRGFETQRERTERLSGVSRGTPMGSYLRCFWYPVAATSELDTWPVKRVRLLAEDLALFRTENGTLGLVRDRCPHRGASLACGMTDGSNLRCAYHGWTFDVDGKCVDTPAEPASSKLAERIRIDGYPVQELGGLVWAYLGPRPAPLLPRYEGVARDDMDKQIGFTAMPCHWLRIAENNMDVTHVEHLHMRYMNWVRAKNGEPPIRERKHARFDFEKFAYGIRKKRLWEGETEDCDEWKVGHPLIYPGNMFLAMTPTLTEMQFRVPVDESTTHVYWYQAQELAPGTTPVVPIPLVGNPAKTEDGRFRPESIQGQDMMMFITQGAPDLATEHLGESDRGIALYRRTLLEEIEKVERGEDPHGVVRDPEENEPFIRVEVEQKFTTNFGGVQNNATSAHPGREVVSAVS